MSTRPETIQLLVTLCPDKLELMLALFDKDPRGPRALTLTVEGETASGYVWEQEVGVWIYSVNAWDGERAEWEVIGRIHGRLRPLAEGREDLPCRAILNTETRKGTIEFL